MKITGVYKALVDNIAQKVTKGVGEVLGGIMKNWLNFGGDLGLRRWVNEQ